MTTITAAESLARCKREMGDELGTIYFELYNRHTWLLFKWSEYVELFGTSPQRVALLNASAPRLFKIVEDAMWADTLLDLAKLTDAPSSGGGRTKKGESLTIRRLPNLVKAPIQKQVSRAVGTALKSVEFARDWRNRTLAHLDLKLATKSGAKPLKPASRAAVKVALKAIAAVLEILEEAYFKTTVYRADLKGDNAIGLLFLLREVDEARAARAARIRAHLWTTEDLAHLQDRRPL